MIESALSIIIAGLFGYWRALYAWVIGLSVLTALFIAAKLANISRPTIYNWKRDDQEFSAAWENAVEAGVDKVETALVKRAIKNSDAAAIAYLKAYRPERYARKDTAEPRTNVTLQITLQEHNKRLERLGLPVPQIEGDYEEDASGPADANRS